MKQKIRIVIADDHAVLRESLAALFQTQSDFAVVGKAANGSQALHLVRTRPPDVLVLDLFMPAGNGFEVLRTLDRAGSRVAALVLTGSDNQLDYAQAVRLGARGLVLKADGPEKLFWAIRCVAKGELAFSDEMANQVMYTMSDGSKPRAALGRLTTREREIVALIAHGLKNHDIAHQLAISENTVKRHLQSIFSKTGTHDRLELAVLAFQEVRRVA
jgi:DNA-binding NarL/FixJ family response regulator